MIAAHPASTTPPGRWRTNTTILCDGPAPDALDVQAAGARTPQRRLDLPTAGACRSLRPGLVASGANRQWYHLEAGGGDGHQRDPVAMTEYLGTDDEFDTSITDFSRRYADQNKIDYKAFVEPSAPGGSPPSKESDRRDRFDTVGRGSSSLGEEAAGRSLHDPSGPVPATCTVSDQHPLVPVPPNFQPVEESTHGDDGCPVHGAADPDGRRAG